MADQKMYFLLSTSLVTLFIFSVKAINLSCSELTQLTNPLRSSFHPHVVVVLCPIFQLRRNSEALLSAFAALSLYGFSIPSPLSHL